MTIITVPETLDILDKFECLMKESVASESIYIRTKETLEHFFKDSNFNSNDKANAISTILGSMSSSITGAAMQTALQWATTERELALKKLELGSQLDIMAQDVLLKKAQIDKTEHESIAVQAETIRVMGKPILGVDGNIASLENTGKIWQDIQIGQVQETNLGKEGSLLDSKLTESHAGIHKAIADTMVNYGAWTYEISSTGFAVAPSRKPSTIVPLSDVQRTIAEEQAKGYAYNAWANAVTASAGMIGTGIASDSAATDIAPALKQFRSILNRLSKAAAPGIDYIPDLPDTP